MKLGVKLSLALIVPITVLMAVFGYFEERRGRDSVHSELVREGRATTRVLQLAVEEALQDGELSEVHALVDQITRFESILGVRFFDAKGNLSYESSSLAAHTLADLEPLHRVLRDRTAVEERHDIGTEPGLTFLVPLQDRGGGLLGALQVVQLASFLDEDARASRQWNLITTLTMITFAGVAVFAITWLTVGHRVESLVHRLREVGSGNLSARLPVQGGDELARLAEEFNSMCARLEEAQRTLLAAQEERRRMEATLRDSERLASLGRIAAVLAHRIGTPLNVIQGRAERLYRRLPEEERAELRIIENQIDRISQSVRAIVDFSRVPEPHLAPADVPAILARTLKLLEHRFQSQGVAVVSNVDGSLPTILADSDQLHEVFVNLTVNALDAMPDGGTLSLAARHTQVAHGDALRRVVEVSLQDTGCGVHAEDLESVFEPFFTTKQVGRGTGLGLFICRNIIEEHGGWMELHSEPDCGTRVAVYVPAVPVPLPLHAGIGGAPV